MDRERAPAASRPPFRLGSVTASDLAVPRILASLACSAVDAAGVGIGLPFYAAAVKRIQGGAGIAGMEGKPGVVPAAAFVYALLVVGFHELVAPIAEKTVPGPHGGMRAALRRAAMFGGLVFGVFNATLFCMLHEWTAGIALCDFARGVGGTMAVAAGYSAYVSRRRG